MPNPGPNQSASHVDFDVSIMVKTLIMNIWNNMSSSPNVEQDMKGFLQAVEHATRPIGTNITDEATPHAWLKKGTAIDKLANKTKPWSKDDAQTLIRTYYKGCFVEESGNEKTAVAAIVNWNNEFTGKWSSQQKALELCFRLSRMQCQSAPLPAYEALAHKEQLALFYLTHFGNQAQDKAAFPDASKADYPSHYQALGQKTKQANDMVVWTVKLLQSVKTVAESTQTANNFLSPLTSSQFAGLLSMVIDEANHIPATGLSNGELTKTAVLFHETAQYLGKVAKNFPDIVRETAQAQSAFYAECAKLFYTKAKTLPYDDNWSGKMGDLIENRATNGAALFKSILSEAKSSTELAHLAAA